VVVNVWPPLPDIFDLISGSLMCQVIGLEGGSGQEFSI
jgi:hypothetical protein